jgi:hypothetical protein
MMSDELLEAQQGVVDLRRRVLLGEEVPPEELAEAVAKVRETREAELMTKAKGGSRNAKTKAD